MTDWAPWLGAWAGSGLPGGADAPQATFVLGTVFVAYLVLGTAGFGSALVAVPLLAWIWPLALVVPLLLLIDVAASLLHAGLNRSQVAWREIPPLVPSALLGAVAGVLLIRHLRTDGLLAVLGLYIVAVGLRGLRVRRGARPWRPAARACAVPAGFAIGLVEGLFGTAGPVVIAWLLRRIPEPPALRATVPPAILVVASTAILGAGLAGLLAQPLLWAWFALLLPVAVLAVVLGHRLAHRLPAARLVLLIHGLLVASGFVLALRALRALV